MIIFPILCFTRIVKQNILRNINIGIILPLFILFLTGIIFPQESPKATIKRIIETREGHKSCWGVLIQLDKLSFNRTIKANELSIIEQKHNRDIKNIMTWRVDKSRHKLTIKFKKGCGDFGTGNIVDVTIKSSAISTPHSEDIKLSISTDL